MKLELNKGEVTTVVNMRAWFKAFGKIQALVGVVFLGPVVGAVSLMALLLGWNNIGTAIFLCIGVLVSALIPTVTKKFKKAKKEVLNNVVAEEHGK